MPTIHFNKETFLKFQSALVEAIESRKDGPALSSLAALKQAVKTFPVTLPHTGHGLDATASHLINDILPGLSCSSLSLALLRLHHQWLYSCRPVSRQSRLCSGPKCPVSRYVLCRADRFKKYPDISASELYFLIICIINILFENDS